VGGVWLIQVTVVFVKTEQKKLGINDLKPTTNLKSSPSAINPVTFSKKALN